MLEQLLHRHLQGEDCIENAMHGWWDRFMHDVDSTPHGICKTTAWGRYYSPRKCKTNLICMYCPVATAAGEANLARDNGCWTATENRSRSVSSGFEQQSEQWDRTYAVAATAEQLSEATW